MIPPDAQTIKALAHVAQNVPAVGSGQPQNLSAFP